MKKLGIRGGYYELLKILSQNITHSKYLTQFPDRHLIVASHWSVVNAEGKWPRAVTSLLSKITLGSYEIWNHTSYQARPNHRFTFNPLRPQPKCTVVVPYVEKSKFYQMPGQSLFKYSFSDWLSRKYDFMFLGRYSAHYRGYRVRYKLGDQLDILSYYIEQNELPNYNYVYANSKTFGHDVSLNSYVPPCPNATANVLKNCILDSKQFPRAYLDLLIDSKFGLVISGDTPSTSRLYDLISSGSIPIILSRYLLQQGLPFIQKIPYYKFCYFIDEERSVPKVYLDLLRITRGTSQYELQEKFENLKFYAKELLWRLDGRQVMENILVETAQGCNPS